MKSNFEKTTPESTITTYRRKNLQILNSPSLKNHNLELEIRFQNIDLLNFRAIYEGLLSLAYDSQVDSPLQVDNIQITYMISAIMDISKNEGFQKFHKPIHRRDITCNQYGKKEKEEFMYKETLIMPFRVSSSTGLSYMVSLAEESPSTKSITMDEGSIIRIKSRISFPLLLPSSEDSSKKLLWRIDLSVVKQITGSEAKELPKIISKMFIPTTTKTFLDHLKDLDAKYRYEVEVEFVDVIAYDHLSKNISVEKNLSHFFVFC